MPTVSFGVPKPMLATSASTLPTGGQWSYEVKWDGYRTLALKDRSRVTLFSRNLKDATRPFRPIAEALASSSPASLLLDGEVVAIDAEGRPSFQALHHSAAQALAYYAFDVLRLDGQDLTRRPIEERRNALVQLVLRPPIFRSDPLPGSPDRIEREVRGLGLEGIIAKRAGSRYEAGVRSDAWVKVKFERRQEFVIGGFTEDGDRVDALVVGVYEGRRLLAAARVRAGLNTAMRRELHGTLRLMRVTSCPFTNLPDARSSHWGEGITAEQMLDIVWVTPKLVAEIAFVEWTREAHLRHARFVGLRFDLPARTVRRER